MGSNSQDQSDSGLLTEERRRLILEKVRESGRVTVAALESELRVSAMTARRDLDALERDGHVRRIYGGAVLPDLSSHEDSFAFRLGERADVKRRLAQAAVAHLSPGESVFLDGSTTGYHAAELILQRDLKVTVITNSLPVMALFNRNASRMTTLIALGGSLRDLTLAFVGPRAVAGASAYLADKALVSCKGMTRDGQITEPTEAEAEIKRAMIEHAAEPMLLIDGDKLERRGLCVVGSARALRRIVASDVPSQRVKELRALGVEVELA
jgi:DeoR/GlpR family transcriptional regulator of sugar metabolism